MNLKKVAEVGFVTVLVPTVLLHAACKTHCGAPPAGESVTVVSSEKERQMTCPSIQLSLLFKVFENVASVSSAATALQTFLFIFILFQKENLTTLHTIYSLYFILYKE